MVLIMSEKHDETTHKVMEWLHNLGMDCCRLNQDDMLESIDIQEDDILLKINGKEIHLSTVTSYWYRKGSILYSKLNEIGSLHHIQKQHLLNEWEMLKEYLFDKFQQINGISNPPRNMNKLIVLEKAQKQGLLTPPFIVSDFKHAIYDETIVKPIGESFNMYENDSWFSIYTETIDKIQPEHFFCNILPKEN